MAEKQFVIFSEDGLPVGVAPPPPPSHVLFDAGTPLADEAGRTLAPDGSYRWMLMGLPCFGGEDGRTPVQVPHDPALAGKSWADLAAATSAEHPYGLLQTARPETTAERRAREKAEADAAATAEAARIGALVVSDVQFAAACAKAGIITENEAIGWVASGSLPAALAAAIDQIPEPQRFAARLKASGAKEFVRASPETVAIGAALGKTPAEIDALFALAATL